MLPTGQVNCSTSIYHDRKTWRKSRNNIDAQIQELRQKLEDLKEIRKHLKMKRPILNEFDDYIDNDDEDSEESTHSTTEAPDLDMSQFFASFETSDNYTLPNLTDNVSKPNLLLSAKNKKRKHNNHHEQLNKDDITNSTRRRNKHRNGMDVNNNTNLFDFNFQEPNTTSRPVQFTNHHRHHHKVYTSTSEPSTFSYTSVSSPPTTSLEDVQSTTSSVLDVPHRLFHRVCMYNIYGNKYKVISPKKTFKTHFLKSFLKSGNNLYFRTKLTI